ncbi:hypothetical protein TNCV_5018411 [Trichonephila clavipes]|nr:hypothetical protein TNCV_5018411 [Trichonephila clavipes]
MVVGQINKCNKKKESPHHLPITRRRRSQQDKKKPSELPSLDVLRDGEISNRKRDLKKKQRKPLMVLVHQR